MENMNTDQYLDKLETSLAGQKEERADSEDQEEPFIDLMRSRNLFELHVLRQLKTYDKSSEQLQKEILALRQIVRDQGRQFTLCFAALRKCQRQVAEFASNSFERHALHPAIKKVVKLVDELLQLDAKAQQLNTEGDCSSKLNTLKQELQISTSIAGEQLSYLDIERIIPAKNDVIDTQQHHVGGYVETDDKVLHGKINDLIKPGIIHRGKVIEPAVVSVFRYTQISEDKKEN